MDKGPLTEGVGSGTIGRVVLARIPIGVDLLSAIYEVAEREGIQKGLILMGIGALQKAVFRNLKGFPREYPVSPRDRLYLEVEGPLELLSLTGYVVARLNGKPHVHAHFSASTVRGENLAVYGGHLDTGTITFVKVAVAICRLADIEMGKRWIEERRTEDLWIGPPE